MENVREALNWRSAVLMAEILIAAGCVFAGWRLVRDNPIAAIQVHHSVPIAVQDTAGPMPLPMASPDPGAAAPRAGTLGLAPATELLTRLSRDDFGLYKSQWQVIQLLVDGTRQFLEQRVLPALMAAAK